MDIYGILGHPTKHSLSPTIHNWGFATKGLAKTYRHFDIAPDKLDIFMTSVRNLPIQGLSVTIPHKETILPFMDSLTPTAHSIGAVNTVIKTRDGRLVGDNTDVTGFVTPLLQQGLRPATALVLGAGGAARAVLHGLHELGTTTFVSCRNQEAGERLADTKKGTTFVPWEKRSEIHAHLLVNTTPLGMNGSLCDQSPWPFALSGYQVCYDLVYTPRMTALLVQARNQGIPILSGLEMFIHQAAAQFRLWTGQSIDIPQALVVAASGL